jgi:Ca2+-binding RTX toxin-like protein
LVIATGPGGDDVTLGTPLSPASTLLADIRVWNTSGLNTVEGHSLTIDDTGNNTPATISITSPQIGETAITSPTGIDATVVGGLFSGGINVRTGTQGDTVNVQSTRGLGLGLGLGVEQLAVVVTDGDTVNVGDNLSLLTGQWIAISSMAPTNAVVNVSDAANSLPTLNVYEYAPSFLTRGTGGFPFSATFTLFYAPTVSPPNLIASPGDDAIRVSGVVSGTAPTIDGGAGNDTMIFPATGGIFPVLPMFADTAGANDTLVFDDSANPTPSTYTVGGTSVSRDGLAPVSFGAGFEEVRLLVGTGANTIAPTATNVRVDVVGNAAADRLVMPDGLTVPRVNFDGAGGQNVIDYSAFTTPVTVDLTAGTGTGIGQIKSVQTVLGGAAGDTLTGTSGDDVLTGGPGNDTLNGLDGADTLDSGDGDDTIVGGPGVDTITSGAGKDTITAGPGVDIVDAGAGDDTLVWNEGDGVDTMTAGEGSDTFQVNGSDAADDAIIVRHFGPEIVVLRSAPTAFSVQAGPDDSIETVLVTTLGGADAVNIQGSPAETRLVVQTGAGADALSIDSNGSEPGGIAKQVFGTVVIDGGEGANTLAIVDAGTLANTSAAITATQVGAAPGNSMFSNGGNLTFANIAAMSVDFGTGNDAITVTTSANTAIVLNGGGQPNADSIDIIQNGATNPTLTGRPESGKYASSNRQPIDYSNFERLTIDSNGTVGVLEFASPTYSVNESAGAATVTVKRTGGVFGPAMATIQVSAGSATATDDFSTADQKVNFAAGEITATFQVPVVADALNEPDETVKLTLVNPDGGATLGSQKTAELTIVNSAPQGACTPRPKVQTQVVAGGSQLKVRIEATPLNSQQNNFIKEISFGQFQNARVAMNGRAVADSQTLNLSSASSGTVTAVELTVERVTPGQGTTVPLTIVDGCGEWKTFVGGGANAGF